MASVYDYINHFWSVAEQHPANPTDVALYHFLLYEANRMRWKMPFPCHTELICLRLSTTKQNINKARTRLKERGLIDFKAGVNIHTPARYQLTLQLTPQLSQPLSQPLSQQATQQLTHSNIKEKEIDKDIITKSNLNSYGKKRKYRDTWGCAVTAQSAEDYEGAF